LPQISHVLDIKPPNAIFLVALVAVLRKEY
jgi:hypothetical protein